MSLQMHDEVIVAGESARVHLQFLAYHTAVLGQAALIGGRHVVTETERQPFDGAVVGDWVGVEQPGRSGAGHQAAPLLHCQIFRNLDVHRACTRSEPDRGVVAQQEGALAVGRKHETWTWHDG
eukprot:2550676-Rhodomonas_salina.3